MNFGFKFTYSDFRMLLDLYSHLALKESTVVSLKLMNFVNKQGTMK